MVDTEKKIAELLLRFVEGSFSQNDIEFIEQNLTQSSANIHFERALRDYWDENICKTDKDEENLDLTHCLDKIHHKINLLSKKGTSEKNISVTKQFISNSLKIYYRFAAVILIPILIISLVAFFKYQELSLQKQIYSEVIAPQGSRLQMELPDGTKVWLNHGSSIKYPGIFAKNLRDIQLNGEAYFEVIKDKKRPFIIHTKNINVHVLGTTLNISAYPDDKTTIVTLAEGKVDLFLSKQENSEAICSMKPGEQAIFNINKNSLTVNKVETEKYMAWRNGQLVISDDPMDVVIKKLERWYNVDIVLEDKELVTYKFTATFTTETLQQALSLISIALPVQYKIAPIENNKDHSFVKGKVYLKKNLNYKHN